MTREAGHGIDDEHRTMAMDEIRKSLQRLMRAGARFRVDNAKKSARGMLLECTGDLFRRKNTAPRNLDDMDRGVGDGMTDEARTARV